MKINIKILMSCALAYVVMSMVVFAGTTGKIAGKITDAQTGEPLISANVALKGTSMGAASDIEGNYVILNIPPGTYTLRISYVGYKTTEITNVNVSVDYTTTIDAALQPTPVEVGEVEVRGERQPLVVKDMTSSRSTITSEQIKNLPVSNVTQLLQLNAGVVMSGGRISIRGGRTSEVGYWIDGISVTDPYNMSSGITVENSAIQELQVISGTFNAEYGQAMSGIVNVVTKQGESKYNGRATVYFGDYLSSDDKFGLNRRAVLAPTSNNKTAVVDSKRELPLEKINPIYNAELTVSGPILKLKDLTFFINGRYFYDEGYFYGCNWFKPNGAPGDSSIVAMNPQKRYSIQGKIAYQITPSVKLSYNGLWNKTIRDRNYFNGSTTVDGGNFNSHNYKYVPYGLPKNIGEAYTQILSLNHILSAKTFYELRVSRYYSHTKQYVYEDPYTSVRYLVKVINDAGATIDVLDTTTVAGLRAYHDYGRQTGIRFEDVVDPNGPDGYIEPQTFLNAPTAMSFYNKGMDIQHFERNTQNWIAKIDFTSQIHKYHEAKSGVEIRLNKLTLHSFPVVKRTGDGTNSSTLWFPMIPEVGVYNRHDYVREPREISAYIQDKIEFKSIIVNVGLRYDYFDPNANIPVDRTDPSIYTPFKLGNKYAGLPEWMWGLTGGYQGMIDSLLKAGAIREYKPEERRAFMQKAASKKMALSPRLGIAFPITEKGVIHLSYGHFFQIPDFQYLYQNPDFKLNSTGNNLLGNPDLKPQKTVMYEIGLQQQLTDDIGIDVTLFYRDVRDWVGTSPIAPTKQSGVYYSMYENKDYENVRGIVFKFEKRYSKGFSFRADYTYQIAEGTYSNPQDQFNQSAANRPTIVALVPMNWDQRHTLNAQLIYDLSNWTLSVIGRYWSGQPYTPTAVREGGIPPAAGVILQNSESRPDQKSIDMTINRAFRLSSRIVLNLFMNIYNLLDQRDATAVHGDTGSAEYSTNQQPESTSAAEYNKNRVSTVEDYRINQAWFTGPRQVQVGLSLEFN